MVEFQLVPNNRRTLKLVEALSRARTRMTSVSAAVDSACLSQMRTAFLAVAVSLLMVFSFSSKALSQPAPSPQGPVGSYVLELYFSNDNRREVWDDAKTKQFLTGFWLLKQTQNETPQEFNSDNRNLTARLKSHALGTDVGTIHYVVKWDKIAHVELTFQDLGATQVHEVQPLSLCSECGWDYLPKSGTYFSWDRFTPNLRQAMQGYMDQDITPMNLKLGKLDRSGSFVLRITNASNEVFYLPIAQASWHVNHYDDAKSLPFHSESSLEIQPVLQ